MKILNDISCNFNLIEISKLNLNTLIWIWIELDSNSIEEK
jgi:hypothetical protein